MTTQFRGLRVDGGGRIIGDLMHHKRFIDLKPYIKAKDTGPMEWIEVKPDSIGMFTGLIDAFEKRAFGGDRFKDQNGKEWVIEYDEAMARFCASNAERRVEARGLFELAVFEIIGNIHEK